jgi:hypothetical protein
MITSIAFTPPVVTADSTYRVYPSCAAYTGSQVGVVETQVGWAQNVDFGGDVGIRNALTQTYKYSWGVNGYASMEVNNYVQGYGWVRWQLYSLVNGVYQVQQTSLFNTLVSGGSPQPDCPCGIPTL